LDSVHGDAASNTAPCTAEEPSSAQRASVSAGGRDKRTLSAWPAEASLQQAALHQGRHALPRLDAAAVTLQQGACGGGGGAVGRRFFALSWRVRALYDHTDAAARATHPSPPRRAARTQRCADATCQQQLCGCA
jgi:hypothetical protein